ncbi:hypothetical protein FQN60_012627 [Etheostoma spectabile]|uniref:Uncharacterized protein n=1 Tax=Etheostoma spectabile TaxID=54343 RepID=A0A5J5D3H0_9PERO|nr:hypothetical protein FQN60_012627 [Etheostoma spectabile]
MHREVLASRQLNPGLNEVLTEVVSMVNFIKTQLFSALCEKMGA